MKHLLVILGVSIFLLSACKNEKSGDKLIPTDVVENPATAQEGTSSTPQAKIFFEKTEHDFGKLNEGERVEYYFVFKNTGNADLVIDNCYGSCGCTVPEWPEEPIKPGKEGKIKISFDSQGRTGANNKTVTILANTTPRSTILRIKAQVTR